MSLRVQRVEKDILRVVAEFLSKEALNVQNSMVTVTRVQAGADLRNAKVFFSLFSPVEGAVTEELIEEVTEQLQQLSPEIQSQIGKSIRMKFCPRLKFQFDHGQENLLKVESVLQELSTEKGE